jgi:K(+)-stimulated pyrophosphate-energized sodium pump
MIYTFPILWWIAPISAITALITAGILYRKLLSEPEGTDKMIEIAGFVKDGAMAYLKRQYKTVAIVFAIIAIILAILSYLDVQNKFVPLLFLSGGLWSAVSGYLGMKTATNASARTAASCQKSLNQGLKTAFRGGSVMGLMVVGFGLLDISIWFFILNFLYDHNILQISTHVISKIGLSGWNSEVVTTIAFQKAKLSEISTILLSYAMGASAMALFARVGGGIFTKAADVGADLVGKIEAGIPEDDPRNPATIADNVGDNVGDVAGMGADLYESYCGSILACTALGASLALTTAVGNTSFIMAPMIVAGGGIVFSIAGIFFVRTKENATQKSLLNSLLIGTGFSSILTLIFTAFLAYFGIISWGIFGSIITGLIAGILIGQATEYYTASNFSPTKNVAKATQDGQAPAILQGISTGMISTGIPVLVISTGIIAAFIFAGGREHISYGIYGIAFAAVGMLSTLGIQLATDAFGPIADNAGGNAEMAGLPPEVRSKTDALDALGNTTAATGKGFAIGSAALTALALISAYMETLKQWIASFAGSTTYFIGKIGFTNIQSDAIPLNNIFFIDNLDITKLVNIFQINVINPKFLAGLFIGSMMCFVFSALTIFAVSKAANQMVNEVRRQFREIKGILEGKATPDYARCVDISTTGALKAMLAPSLLAIITPIAVGFILDIAGVIGLLTGALVTGFSLAIKLNNSGGSWDNAKKYIEEGHFGGKGTDAHKASVTGDTVGDPFKDTAGPSLNILIKLMTIVSIVFIGFIVKFGIHF